MIDVRKRFACSASTRGDGKIGEDVTLNVKTIESVPLRLKKPIDIIVEGEIWMSKKIFEELNHQKKEERRTAFCKSSQYCSWFN